MDAHENVRRKPSSKETGSYPSSFLALFITNPVLGGRFAGWEKSAAVTFLMSDLFSPR